MEPLGQWPDRTISDVVNCTDSSADTLQYDGTAKFGHKYASFQLATEEGSYTLRLNYCTDPGYFRKRLIFVLFVNSWN